MAKQTPSERFAAASEREAQRFTELCEQAQEVAYRLEWSEGPDCPDLLAAQDSLRAAAKAWTNANHQTSRCAKAVREAKARDGIRRVS